MATGRIPTGCIVVGIDAARATDRALDWAADQAALEGRHLHLVHGTDARVIAGSATASVTSLEDGSGLAAELVTTGHAILARATTRAVSRHPELVVHQTVRTAEPGRLLGDLSTDAALVVVGSRGRGPALRWGLGSVGDDLTERAACPVVVLRPRHDGSPHEEVLVALDEAGSAADRAAVMRFALRHAAVRRRPLTLLLVRTGDAGTRPPSITPAEGPGLSRERKTLVDAVAAGAEPELVVPTTLLVGRGTPAECILALAGHVELVVLGHHPCHSDQPTRPPLAVDILDHAPATVAVVPLDHPVEPIRSGARRD